MSDQGQHHRIGPEHGKLILRTTRQGLAAQAGHDLTIEITRWSGEVVLTDDPSTSTVKVTVDTGSFRIVEGSGGLKPLSEKDKRDIAHTARKLLDADRHPEAVFTSTAAVANAAGGGAVDGILTVLGKDRPLRLDIVRSGERRYRCSGSIVQSEYGIRPYTAFFGALKLADRVEVETEVDLSGEDR
jgi:polyisoprenoid-binding protein YceI